MDKHIHHWVITSDASVKMTSKERSKHLNCIAREAICKTCGEVTKKFERIWDIV